MKFLTLFLLLAPLLSAQPNFIVIFADDLGWGDLSSYGHPTIATPNLDRLAAEGQRWTNFYVGASVCTPSRAALLTGRLPIRSGMMSAKQRVLFPDSHEGIPASEITIAEMLKENGFRTGHVGKWHLGHLPQYLPTRHGFDSYFGIPYSNDMDPVNNPSGHESRRARFWNPKIEYWNVPLMRNEEIIERPADQHTITKRYGEEAVKFIRENRGGPFFLYLAHTMVHVPLFRSKEFEGVSRRGMYGDTVEEIDWSVGRILETLDELGIAENTLVFFSSDNGPWLTYDDHGGSAGLLRMGKGSTWEGGMRVPGIFRQPGTVKPGIIREVGATMDLLPTFAAMAGAKPPADRALDGYDLGGVLTGKASKSPRDEVFFYRAAELWAVRMGPWKAHYRTKSGYLDDPLLEHNPPLLFNLEIDPSEKYNIAAEHTDVLERITQLVEKHRKTLPDPLPDHLAARGD